MDLHPLTGKAALQACGLMKEFRKFARPDGDCNKVIEGDGTVLLDENSEVVRDNNGARKPGVEEVEFGITGTEDSEEVIEGRPEIDRAKLKEILLASIEPGTIQ